MGERVCDLEKEWRHGCTTDDEDDIIYYKKLHEKHITSVHEI